MGCSGSARHARGAVWDHSRPCGSNVGTNRTDFCAFWDREPMVVVIPQPRHHKSHTLPVRVVDVPGLPGASWRMAKRMGAHWFVPCRRIDKQLTGYQDFGPELPCCLCICDERLQKSRGPTSAVIWCWSRDRSGLRPAIPAAVGSVCTLLRCVTACHCDDDAWPMVPVGSLRGRCRAIPRPPTSRRRIGLGLLLDREVTARDNKRLGRWLSHAQLRLTGKPGST